jgi:hypothetical protein
MTTAELLIKAAVALENGDDPFNSSFLSTNDVSLDQCFALADQLATGARIMARGIQDPKSVQGQAMILTLVGA